MGFRMPTDRLVEVMVYQDAVALRSRGSPTPWTLLRRDWDRWPELVRAMLRLDATRTQHERGAPFFYRMQGYGRALDLLLVLNSLAATFFVLSRR
jgi:hypothetical protein